MITMPPHTPLRKQGSAATLFAPCPDQLAGLSLLGRLRDLTHRLPTVWADNNRLAKLLLFCVIDKQIQLFFKKNRF